MTATSGITIVTKLFKKADSSVSTMFSLGGGNIYLQTNNVNGTYGVKIGAGTAYSNFTGPKINGQHLHLELQVMVTEMLMRMDLS